MQNEKSQHVILVLDRERLDSLDVLMHVAKEAGSEHLARHIQEPGLQKAFVSLWSEIEDKRHDLGWCDDPDCKNKTQGRKAAANKILNSSDAPKMPHIEADKVTKAASVLIDLCKSARAPQMKVIVNGPDIGDWEVSVRRVKPEGSPL